MRIRRMNFKQKPLFGLIAMLTLGVLIAFAPTAVQAQECDGANCPMLDSNGAVSVDANGATSADVESDALSILFGPPLTDFDVTDALMTNDLWGSLLGIDLDLLETDLDTLAGGTLPLQEVLDGLVAGGDPLALDQLLDLDVTLAEIFSAASDVANGDGQVDLANVLTDLQTASDDLIGTVQAGDLMDVDDTIESLTGTDIRALDLVGAFIELYNFNNITDEPIVLSLNGDDLGLDSIINSVDLQVQIADAPAILFGDTTMEASSSGLRVKASLDLIDTAIFSDSTEILGGLLPILPEVASVSVELGQLDLYLDISPGSGIVDLVDTICDLIEIDATLEDVDVFIGSIEDEVFFDRTHVISEATDLDYGTIGSITVDSALVGGIELLGLEVMAFYTEDSSVTNVVEASGPYPQLISIEGETDIASGLVVGLLDALELRVDSDLTGDLGSILTLPVLSEVEDAVTDVLSPTLTSVLSSLNADILGDGLGLGLDTLDLTVICEDTDDNPSDNPDDNPSDNPDDNPSDNPDDNPSDNPDDNPSDNPDDNPSDNPDDNPRDNPDDNPSGNPDDNPSDNPDDNPSDNPDDNPSDNPDDNPSDNPDDNPSDNPGDNPNDNPDDNPSDNPDDNPDFFRDNDDAEDEFLFLPVVN